MEHRILIITGDATDATDAKTQSDVLGRAIHHVFGVRHLKMLTLS